MIQNVGAALARRLGYRLYINSSCLGLTACKPTVQGAQYKEDLHILNWGWNKRWIEIYLPRNLASFYRRVPYNRMRTSWCHSPCFSPSA